MALNFMHIRFAFHIALCLSYFSVAAQPGGSINQKDAQGRKQGPWQRTWAESTQLRYTGQFKDNKPVGNFIYYSTDGKVESRIDHYPGSDAAHARHYHPGGKLMAEGRYIGQEKDSTWNYYDDAGKLRNTEHWKAGKMDGLMISYFVDGKVAERRNFKDGKAHGLAEQFYEDGTQRYRANFVNGEPQDTETFYFANGKKEIEGRYVNGDRDGQWTYYNNDGSVQMQVLYAQGKFVKQQYDNGTFKEYWDDQQLKGEYTYKNSKLDGPFTEWYDNGTWADVPVKLGPDGLGKKDVERELKGQAKKREGVYKNGVLEGPVKEYDETGKLVSTLVYAKGVPVTGGVKP